MHSEKPIRAPRRLPFLSQQLARLYIDPAAVQVSCESHRGGVVQRHVHCTLRGSELTVWQRGNELWATICKIYGIFQRPCPLHCKQISPADYVCSLLSRLWGTGGPRGQCGVCSMWRHQVRTTMAPAVSVVTICASLASHSRQRLFPI